MRSKNYFERRKRIIAFAGIYAASIALLLFILSALGMRFSPPEQNVVARATDATGQADIQLLRTDSLLHGELQTLQQLDFKYRMTSDTASHNEQAETAARIHSAEAGIEKTIDSIQSLTGDYSSSERIRYTTMLSTFRSSLADRMLLKNGQAPGTTGNAIVKSSADEMVKLKNDVVLKDDNINRLQAEIKRLQEAAFAPSKVSGVKEAQKGETDLLKTAFSDQQKELEALKEKYIKLKNDNNTLNVQVAELKKNIVAKPPPADAAANAGDAVAGKINMLGQQIEALNADLSFAKIDCNLARTDAQQMISNARQRKELLSETLAMLNSLVKSGDTEIQRKAKEKINRLNRIATTLHD